MFLLAGALAYGGAWLLGLVLGFVVGNPARNVTTDQAALNGNEDQALGRAHLGRRRARLHGTRRRTGRYGRLALRQQSPHRCRAAGPTAVAPVAAGFPAGCGQPVPVRHHTPGPGGTAHVGGDPRVVGAGRRHPAAGGAAADGRRHHRARRAASAGVSRQTVGVVRGAPDGRHDRPRRPVGGADRRRRRRRPQRAHGRRRAGAPGVDRAHRTGHVRDRLPADPVRASSTRSCVWTPCRRSNNSKRRCRAFSSAAAVQAVPLDSQLDRSRRAGRLVRRHGHRGAGSVVARRPERVLAPQLVPQPARALLSGRVPQAGTQPLYWFRQRRRPAALGRGRTSAAAHPPLSDLQRGAQPGGRTEPGLATAQGRVVHLHAVLLRLRVPHRRTGGRPRPTTGCTLTRPRASTPATSGR